jgi:hypothetical protein
VRHIDEKVKLLVGKLTSFTIGGGGIDFLPLNELEAAQKGYESLRDGLVVIGHESACGDPIGLDTNSPECPPGRTRMATDSGALSESRTQPKGYDRPSP